jgi:hypothetical protein
MMKANTRAVRTVLVLTFLAVMIAGSVQAQETMLGAHGGSNQSGTPGSMSIVNQSNANTTLIGTPSPGVGLSGVATHSNGRVYATTGVNKQNPSVGPRLIEINPATGALMNDIGRLQTPTGENCFVGDLSFQPGTNVLYAVLTQQSDGGCTWQGSTETGGVLATINTSNAMLTMIGRDPSLGNSNGGLAFHPNGTLYFTPCWVDDSRLLTLNPGSAAIVTSKNLTTDTCYMGLAARPSDGTLFASYNWETNFDPYVLVTLNPSNGNASLIGHTYTTGIIHDLTFTDAIEVGFKINAGMNDAWFDPATPGQGFLISVFEDTGIVFIAWFTYDTERPPGSVTAILGEPGHRWVTAQGSFSGDTVGLTAFLSEGGVFDMPEPAVGAPASIGSITIVWHDCENATLSYDLDPPGVSGEIEIRRIVADNVKYCEAYQP